MAGSTYGGRGFGPCSYPIGGLEINLKSSSSSYIYNIPYIDSGVCCIPVRILCFVLIRVLGFHVWVVVHYHRDIRIHARRGLFWLNLTQIYNIHIYI